MTSDWKPNTKVTSGTVSGAVTVLLLWAVESLGLSLPGPVQAAIATLVAVSVAYLVPNKE